MTTDNFLSSAHPLAFHTADYTAAPACDLLATHCAICGRPLLDADSVTAGMGPTCRENVGYDAAGPDGPTDGPALFAALRALGLNLPETLEGRALANRLVHVVGLDPKGARAARAIVALWALGYHALATKLVERVGITVTAHGPDLIVRAPYSTRFGAALRRVNAWAKFVAADKTWKVSAVKRPALWQALVETYEGAALLSAKGVSVVARPARAAAPAAE